MLVKVIIVFLLAMVLLGMIGKLLFPDAISRAMRRPLRRNTTCKSCGRPQIGKTCPCKSKDKTK